MMKNKISNIKNIHRTILILLTLILWNSSYASLNYKITPLASPIFDNNNAAYFATSADGKTLLFALSPDNIYLYKNNTLYKQNAKIPINSRIVSAGISYNGKHIYIFTENGDLFSNFKDNKWQKYSLAKTAYFYSHYRWKSLALPKAYSGINFLNAQSSPEGDVHIISGLNNAIIYKNDKWRLLDNKFLPKNYAIEYAAISSHGHIIIISTDNHGNYIYENNHWQPLKLNHKNNKGLLNVLAMNHDASVRIACIQFGACYLYKHNAWHVLNQAGIPTHDPNSLFADVAMSKSGNEILLHLNSGVFLYQKNKWKRLAIPGAAANTKADEIAMSANGETIIIGGYDYTAIQRNGKWQYLVN